ncbi:unnamed protein product [Lymnaea stagnalis]|uniref:Uncharacterized protein n=1 Tax=Lymnaea stagnalis TaxID=6523 RepID=A0AAV2HF13_LYMST
MKNSHGPHDSPPDKHEHETSSDVMLSQPYIPRHDGSSNSSTSTVLPSANGTVSTPLDINIIQSGAVSSIGSDDSNSSSTTLDYEQLSREFYRSYDPSIGLHTAAVLGGILVWLVIYVIYRTKVRKCVLRLIKKKCKGEDEEDSKKDSDSEEKDSLCVTNPNMLRALINPSIIIETTPPESLPQSPGTYDQFLKSGAHECLSPYSIPGAGNNEDGTVFQFPYPGGSQLQFYHQQFCQEHQDAYIQQQSYLQQLPKSEMDIPTATAQWVQNMPLAARSHQDFAGLMLTIQSRGLLAMNKPCSCPLVCPRSPQPLPLLDFPNSWNKSLPVLSNSLSSQLLSAYETATSGYKQHKDIKDIINASRKMNKLKHRNEDANKRDYIEYTQLDQKHNSDKCQGREEVTKTGRTASDSNVKKKTNKTPPNLTIRIPDGRETIGLLNNMSLNRSPVPIPVTPTVMIQNAKPVCRRHTGCDSNSSVTSSSSTDFLSGPRHMTVPGQNIPSPHLLSPACDKHQRRGSSISHFSWSREDVRSYRDKHESRRSGSVSPHFYKMSHHQGCSFSRHPGCKREAGSAGSDSTKRHSSWTGSDTISIVGPTTPASSVGGKPQQPHAGARPTHKRTLSDYNKYYADLMTTTPTSQLKLQHRRSLSADVTYSLNFQREQGSPTFSNGSNKNSLGASSYSHSPSPHLLQVPDPNNLRPLTPDFTSNNNCQAQTSNNSGQLPMRHCGHSDGNITYNCTQHCQNLDNPITRRHSTYMPPPGEVNVSLCADNSVRATSSFGSGSCCNTPCYPLPPQPHPCQHKAHRTPHEHHHHSTGVLTQDCAKNSGCNAACGGAPQAQANLNRSYSAAIMETKL